MAKQIPKVVLKENGFALSLCDVNKLHMYPFLDRMEQITGTYKRGRPEGMQVGVAGIFTADTGEEFVIYTDWSANLKEDTDAKGYPTNEFLNRKAAAK